MFFCFKLFDHYTGKSWEWGDAWDILGGGSEAEKSNLMFSLEILGRGRGQGDAAAGLARE